jgi:hypothetical protein
MSDAERGAGEREGVMDGRAGTGHLRLHAFVHRCRCLAPCAMCVSCLLPPGAVGAWCGDAAFCSSKVLAVAYDPGLVLVGLWEVFRM